MRSISLVLLLLLLLVGVSRAGEAIAAEDFAPPPGAGIQPAEFAQWLAAASRQPGAPSGGYLNALALSGSPYLQQHAGNPIAWRPWNENTLERARKLDRLVFLSIGYSTCHWCHVMNRESFEDPRLAVAINENFVAVKVDREELPDVDRHYSAILEAVAGSAGWPLTAILLPDGTPVFIDSYMGPDRLFATLQGVVATRRQSPERLTALSRLIGAAMPPVQTSDADGDPLAAEEFSAVTASLARAQDPEFGGLGQGQKFPQESLLLFMNEMARQGVGGEALGPHRLQLEHMARGGMYDHVNGGFFRYSTDQMWRVPHYEKMLYNQALLLQVYSEYELYSSRAGDFGWLITDLLAFISQWLQLAEGGYASALAAEYRGLEGGYYLWPEAAIEAVDSSERVAAGLTVYRSPVSGGLYGIMLAAPVSPEAARIRRALRQRRQDWERPFQDGKAITAWNAALVSALAAAAMLEDQGTDLNSIEGQAELLWARTVVDGHLLRVRYSSGETIEGTLEDYAFLLRALLDVYDLSGDALWLKRGDLVARALQERFVSAGEFVASANGLTAPVGRGAGYVDGEMPAADAVAIEALWRHAARTGDGRLRQSLRGLLRSLRAKFRRAPLQNLYAGKVLAEIDLGSRTALQYFAAGKGRVSLARRSGDGAACPGYELAVSLASGWHINSREPLQDYLVPTRVSAGGADLRVTYPEPVISLLDFAGERLSVYEGDFRISLQSDREGACPVSPSADVIELDLQACSNEVCLPPERLRLAVSGRV